MARYNPMNCLSCNEEFTPKRVGQSFCKTKCNKRKRRKGWSKARKAAIKRDGYQCQECGQGVKLEAHHIRYHALNGGNEPENLVTLCDGCHKQRHKEEREEFYQEWKRLFQS